MSGQSGAEERLLAGRYLLSERLGRGAMGTVWRSQDRTTGRQVAVKELSVTGLPPGELSALYSRVAQGVRAASRLHHAGIVTVFDMVEHDGRPWIVMELIDGRSLADVLAMEGALLPRDAARLGLPVLAALEQAHGLGVLHLGVKPANVLLERGGRVLLTDFGVNAVEGSLDPARTAEVLGAPDYLAPERVGGRTPGPESDVWSAGATLYTAVEGRSPFRRATPSATLLAVTTEPPPTPVHAGSLAPVLEAMLCKDPERRPSVEQAQRMLGDMAVGRPPGAQAPIPGGARTAEITMATPVGSARTRGITGTATAGTARPAGTAESRATGAGARRTKRKPNARVLITAASLTVTLIVGGISVAKVLSGSDHTPRPPAVTQTTPPPSAPPGNAGTAAPPAPGNPRQADPRQVVQDYYAAINARDYGHAWSLGGRNIGGAYGSWVGGFAQTASVAVTVISVSGDTVTMRLDAEQTNGTHRYFAGTYTVQNGEIVAANVHGG
ncbi:protein kinase [Streptomyces olivoreticuli]